MLIIGDCRDTMRAWIAAGVRAQMCVSSPPYWGLRDYGTAQWEGGDAGCDHLRPPLGGTGKETLVGTTASANGTWRQQYVGTCGKCGAARTDRQLGLEPTIAEYVANMVEVFGLVRELLADDGVLWLNLGDSYAANAATAQGRVGFESERGGDTATLNRSHQGRNAYRGDGIKAKDLCGIPWRVAFALQADGWWLRQDIIWAKPNPMPESVTDRCTKSHEYLFLLAKSERYYYDAAAIAERAAYVVVSPGKLGAVGVSGRNDAPADAVSHSREADGIETRNRRSVWTVTTQPYADAHFATFPRALVEPCILAGSRVGDTVLDPFMGSGTVGQVAQDLGRKWLGCELNPAYGKLADQRTAQQGMALHAAD